jgi:hypothetical protein
MWGQLRSWCFDRAWLAKIATGLGDCLPGEIIAPFRDQRVDEIGIAVSNTPIGAD